MDYQNYQKIAIASFMKKYEKIAKNIRKQILEMIYRTKSPHIGSSFSIVEILTALYFKYLKVSPKNPNSKNRDIFILSKGHACPALYATLAERGFFKKSILEKFAVDNATLEQHPTRDVTKGIEVSTGSLGHGLSIGAGMALAAKKDKSKRKIYVLVGDGELAEGQNWEAMLFAYQHRLDNLILIVDYNKLQALGPMKKILDLYPLAQKIKSFGWSVKEINGHNFKEIFNTFKKIPFQKNKPNAIIANTIKGKGVSFMENKAVWHSKYPNEKEYEKAKKELE